MENQTTDYIHSLEGLGIDALKLELRRTRRKYTELDKKLSKENCQARASFAAFKAKEKELGFVNQNINRFVKEGSKWPFQSKDEQLTLRNACVGALEWANKDSRRRMGELRQSMDVYERHASNASKMKNDMKYLENVIILLSEMLKKAEKEAADGGKKLFKDDIHYDTP